MRKNKKTPATIKATGVWLYNLFRLFLVQEQVNLNGASNSTTYHWVVTDSEEAHHLYVSRN